MENGGKAYIYFVAISPAYFLNNIFHELLKDAPECKDASENAFCSYYDEVAYIFMIM